METADELAIRSLAAAYTDAVNRRDADAMAAVYAPDGELHATGSNEPVIGIEKLRKRFRRLVEREREFLMQFTHSGVIAIDGDRAQGRWWFSEYKKPVGQPFEMVMGVYQDEVVRLAEGWRFAKRVVSGQARWVMPGGEAIATYPMPDFLPISGLPTGAEVEK